MDGSYIVGTGEFIRSDRSMRHAKFGDDKSTAGHEQGANTMLPSKTGLMSMRDSTFVLKCADGRKIRPAQGPGVCLVSERRGQLIGRKKALNPLQKTKRRQERPDSSQGRLSLSYAASRRPLDDGHVY